MEFIGSKDYWDEKYTNRSDNPLSPETSLVESISYFKNGSVLDLHVVMAGIHYFCLKTNSRCWESITATLHLIA